ncbi:MAG TPA: glucose 1-dehydrogenase [Planctomycetes bacterium]|nr:glucose 1-dehydrogenase [Planctomycetaceae bacterium]HIM31368.1 glucose 1-dehydrogenase [Planctomycetota bacterium]
MARTMFDLTGKVALVTGGAQGLGAAIAASFAVHGATTVVCDIDMEAAVTTARQIINAPQTTGHAEAMTCDVRNDDQVRACVAQTVQQFGRIDVLVNNAGVHRPVDPLDWSQADVEAILAVNLLGSFYMASAVGRVMVKQRSGSIVNMSALGGGIVGLGRAGSIYGITKGGIVSLTRDLAAEWGVHSIRVNALAPGWIRTPMTRALQENAARSTRVLERVPLGRWGEPEDVAGVALFLASDASKYVTGHTIPVDGGAANVLALNDQPTE